MDSHLGSLDRDMVVASILSLLSVSERLALFEVSHLLNDLVRQTQLPRHTLIEVTTGTGVKHIPSNHIVRVTRTPTLRLSSEFPSLSDLHLREPTGMGLYMHQDAVSELTLSFKSSRWCAFHISQLLPRLMEVAQRMLDGGVQPLHTLYVISQSQSSFNISELVSIIPSIFQSVCILCLCGYWGSTYSVTRIPVTKFTMLTTLKLKNMVINLNDIDQTTMSRLESLDLNECQFKHTFSGCVLSSATSLQHLSISSAPHVRNLNLPLAVWESIRTLTWLSGLRLVGYAIPHQVLTVFTRLQSLSVGCTQPHFTVMQERFSVCIQTELDKLSRLCPGLLYLGVDTEWSFSIPRAWTSLRSVSLSHRVRYAESSHDSITRMVVRPESCHNIYGHIIEVGAASPMPSRLTYLQAPHHDLRHAYACRELLELVWTAPDYACDASLHSNILSMVMAECWPLLDKVRVLSSHLGSWDDSSVQSVYNAELLEALAVSCRAITQVVVNQSESHGVLEAIARMSELRSVTLIGMRVSITQLHNLLRRCRLLRLVELIGVVGVTSAEMRGLRMVASVSGTHVSCLRMGDVDVGSSMVFDSSF